MGECEQAGICARLSRGVYAWAKDVTNGREHPAITGAVGWPGLDPRWTSSAKSGVGTAYGSHSRVWFTLSHGIINEVYYPRVDQANIRDLGLIVTDGSEFFSEEKR